jgi:hypothetical protein
MKNAGLFGTAGLFLLFYAHAVGTSAVDFELWIYYLDSRRYTNT